MPRLANETRTAKVLDLRRRGARIETIARKLGCGRTTVSRALRAHGFTDYHHRRRGTW